MADAGANQYTFHLEATGELKKMSEVVISLNCCRQSYRFDTADQRQGNEGEQCRGRV